MTMPELLEEAHLLGIDNEFGRRPLVEFHRRLVLPVGCLMISLIGLPLGLQARPGKKAIGIQAGIAFFILYYIFFTLGRSFAEEGVLPVGLAMWMPNSFFFLLAMFWIIRVSSERPLFPEFLSTVLTKILGKLSSAFRSISNTLLNRIKGKVEDSSAPAGSQQPLAIKPAVSGNPKSRVFHVPACEYFSCRNCTLEFRDIQVALDAGFEPCRACKHFMDL